MAIREGNFYGVWPVLDGKILSLQWGEIRSNQAELKAIARNSVQELETGVDELNALRALLGQSYGDLDFRNRFRFFYDQATDEICCQKNDGTVDAPSWTDAWCVRFHDGQFQVVSQGGIQSSAGFYGPGLQSIEEVAESGSSADVSIRNPTKIFFNADDGLGVQAIASGANAGSPEIRFTQPFGRAQQFSKSGSQWTVNHGFGISPVLVQVMDNDDRVVIPDRADVSDPNIAYFYFNSPFKGSVYIASGGIGASSLVPRDPFYLVVRTNEMPASPGNTLEPNADLIFDKDFFYVNVDLDEDAGGAHKTAFISLTDAATGGGGAALTMREVDNNPTVNNVDTIVVTNGTLTDDGGGQVTLDTGGNGTTDHGALTGLGDDDHTQYILEDGTRAFSGDVNFGENDLTGIGLITGDNHIEGQLTAEAFYVAGTENEINTNGFQAAPGSAATPSFTFGSDLNTGMYRVSNNVIALSSGGSASLTLSASTAVVGASRALRIQPGSVGTPALSFDAEPTTGVYRSAAGFIDFSVLGSKVAGLNAQGLHVEDSIRVENTVTAEAFYFNPGSGGEMSQDGDNILIKPSTPTAYVEAGSGGLLFPDGTVDEPSLAYATDTATGFWKPAAEQVGIAIGGVTRFTCAAGSLKMGSGMVFRSQSGSEAQPSLVWNSEAQTGLYRGANSRFIGFSLIGVRAAHINKEGLNVVRTVKAQAFYFHGGGEAPQSYVEEFGSAVEWVVNHNLDRPSFIAQAYKGTGFQIIPDQIHVNDRNTAYFYFAEAQDGKAVILGI